MPQPYREREDPNPIGVQRRWGQHALGREYAKLPPPETFHHPEDPDEGERQVLVYRYPQAIEVATEYGVSRPVGRTGDTGRIKEILTTLTEQPVAVTVSDFRRGKRENYEDRFAPMLNEDPTLPDGYRRGLQEAAQTHL